jgi:hypothetical protein
MPSLRRRELRCSLVGEVSGPGWPPIFACCRGSSDAEVTPNDPRTRESPRCRTPGAHAFAARRVEGAAQPCFSRLCCHGASYPRFLANGARLFDLAAAWLWENRASEAPAQKTRQGREVPRMPANSRPGTHQQRPHPRKAVLAGSTAEIRGVSWCVAVWRGASRSRRAGVGACEYRILASQVRPERLGASRQSHS